MPTGDAYRGRRRARDQGRGTLIRGSTAVQRGSAHLVVAVIMFVAIVVAGIMMDKAGRDPESIAAALGFYSATGIGLVTALVKLTDVKQSTDTVERRTNGEMREMVREEIRAALDEMTARRRPRPHGGENQ